MLAGLGILIQRILSAPRDIPVEVFFLPADLHRKLMFSVAI
jgi:hypothetical protein